MGLDTMKFHQILHLVELIMNNGVPNVVDTGPNESHHKPTKYYSKLTQKNEKTFEKQTATREDEFHLIDLAMLELEGKCVWEYLDLDQKRGPPNFKQDGENPGQKDPNLDEIFTGGTKIKVFRDDDGSITYDFPTIQDKDIYWDTQVIQFLFKLQEIMKAHGLNELDIRCEHKRNGTIFRGHPQYRGTGQWNDWVKLDWGRGHGHLPAEIWCFIDFTTLADNVSVKYGDVTVKKGVYAVVESSEYVKEDRDGVQVQVGSDLLRVIRKEIAWKNERGEMSRKFYLADVEAFVDPICVVPDIGAEDKVRYFEVLPRKKWSDVFIKWLMTPYKAEMDELKEEEGKEEYLQEIDYKAKAQAQRQRAAAKKGGNQSQSKTTGKKGGKPKPKKKARKKQG
jgi:hypothetical protein